MCGIAGFTRFNHQYGDASLLEKMGEAIAHRGPDAHGVYLDDSIGLCHRRLSILDLSEAGTQPMYSNDGNVVLIFNGEIYNFLELKAEISSDEYEFKTKTDTEVILALYQKEGEGFVKKLNGMFAIALWDKNKSRLILARDRLGKKPLYYWQDEGDLVFASELKSIFEIESFKKEIRLDAVYDFFAYQYVPDPKTIFKHVYKLEPAHYMVFEEGHERKECYWQLNFEVNQFETEEELEAKLDRLIRGCTKHRMISDVPLGAFLSGGVDSSGIVAMMSQEDDKAVTTCSIGFDDEKYNEVEFARIVANQYQSDHHEFFIRQNMLDNLDEIVGFFDEPFADPSLVPTYHVSKLARQKVTVALAGDGGDELFAGYEKYTNDDRENRLKKYFPSFLRALVFAPLGKILMGSSNNTFKRAGSLLSSIGSSPSRGFYISNSQMSDVIWEKIAKDEVKKALSSYHPSQITEHHYNTAQTKDHLSKILYTDLKTYLPGDILVKVDRMSMAHSLEVRAPLLDYTLAEFATSIPSDFKYRDGEKKYILKNTFKKLLPDEILYRKKMGFAVPLASWFRQDLKDKAYKLLFASNSGLCDYFNVDAIRELWEQHQEEKLDHSAVLWSMTIFQLWWNRYIVPAEVP